MLNSSAPTPPRPSAPGRVASLAATPANPDIPPRIPWARWYDARGRVPGQGRHTLFDGPTQSGKTVLCRYAARQRDFVVVLGTKPVDASLDAYVAEGYTRIDHWPPTRSDMRKGDWDGNEARFILWPKIKKRDQLRAFRPVYARCLDDIFVDGRWTIVADEGLWLASKGGLNLGQELGDIAYGSASNQVSLYLCIQRPAGLPRITWASCADAYIFKTGVTNDLRELASLGTYDPKPVAAAIKSLGRYEFLDLPCRGGSEWSISKVELGGER